MNPLQREKMLKLSRDKMVAPYELVERLTLYCPQENLEAVEEPLLREHFQHMRDHYRPPVKGSNTILLLLPCTKAKPYAISEEHKHINRHLLAEGFAPLEEANYPPKLNEQVEDQERGLLNNGIWQRDNVRIHRMVVSDLPRILVPYEYIYYYNNDFSVFSRYDDPGLFEHRGNTVCPWRDDCSALYNGKDYRWGPLEKSAYVKVHNIHAAAIAEILMKLKKYYAAIFAYVTPKMTHRSFLSSTAEKKEIGLPLSRRTDRGAEKMVGVNDLHPSLVKLIPGGSEVEQILDRLRKRLGLKQEQLARVKAYFATGGGVATGLVLPETLYFLDYHLKIFSKTCQ